MSDGPDSLVFKTESVPIGVRVVTFREADRGGLSYYSVRYRGRVPFLRPKNLGELLGEPSKHPRKEQVKQAVLHHDGMDSAQGTFNVLLNRGLSTHLIIDAEGTVFQPLDLSDIAYHAAAVNDFSVGVDLNNPIRPDRARASLSKRGGVRNGVINGSRVSSLGYTDAQYESLIAVLNGLFKIFPNLKPQAPVGADGKVLRNRLVNLEYPGVVGHQHVSAAKWDPGPAFDWERVLIGIRGNRVYFPVTLPKMRNLASVPKGRALEFAESYFRVTEEAGGGYFPVGLNQAWHTGVHVPFEAPGAPVLAPMDGVILVARNDDPLPRRGSANVIVIQHETKIGSATAKLYTVLSHLQKVSIKRDTEIGWIRRFRDMPGVTELNDDDLEHPPSAPGFEAFSRGRVALAQVPVKAGELIGRVGTFSAERGRKPQALLDMAVLAARPVFSIDDQTFEHVDDDDGPDILCNSRTVWKKIRSNPEELRGLVEGSWPLADEEVREFYQADNSARQLRRMAVRHVTEYSDTTEFGGLFGGGVDFEWYTRKQARQYMSDIRKFLWWDEGVTRHAGLPQDRRVFAYHPIMLFTVLAVGEARRALTVGADGAEKGLSGDELSRARRTDRALEIEQGLDAAHEEISAGEDLGESMDAAEEGMDPDSLWMDSWEQGEWEP